MKSMPVIHPARPPLARIRRVIFDTIESRQKINKVLDLCCGSGSLGLEALSRGANEVVFVDKDPSVIRNLNETVKKWDINSDILNIKARTYISNALKVNFPDEVFDTLFIDLPFPEQKENLVLENLLEKNLIDENSIISVRSYRKHQYEHANFKVLKEKIEGKSHIMFLQKA
ncbi:methyltransferase domain-containing protein [Candidatus Cytomitobacter indipagum]|uniref:Methyltransferase domain-containing protein n=2 Tax=Candidatus Cytomitobacter indipagum TaxID=2601575 RepID=A0A5C0UEX5_9PROT|nr:methyltransferase domain-containing protein [Candidatus Cytomitobacter indipagum]